MMFTVFAVSLAAFLVAAFFVCFVYCFTYTFLTGFLKKAEHLPSYSRTFQSRLLNTKLVWFTSNYLHL